MLSRSQIYTLFMPSKRKEGKETTNIFSQLPLEIILCISDCEESPGSDFAKALRYVAHGNLDEAKAILEKNPRLVLYAGTVVTRSGLIVVRTTLLECALGAGDFEMANMILPYFSEIEDENGNSMAEAGKKEKSEQLKRYRPHIEGMLTQKPYDLTNLISIIINSSAEDVTKALNKDLSHESKLCKALKQFRDDVRPKKLKKPGMHYNYQTLIHAFEMLDKEWENLKKEDNFDKCDLVWRQVIGYLQRGLPAVDQMAFAQGLYDLVKKKAKLERDLKFKYGKDGLWFPNTSSGDSDFSGLGGDYGIAIVGGLRCSSAGAVCGDAHFKTYVEQKLQTCRLFCHSHKHKYPGV